MLIVRRENSTEGLDLAITGILNSITNGVSIKKTEEEYSK